MGEKQEPTLVLLLSGKRKSGKDYIAEKLLQVIGSEICSIVRISAPIKSYYAKEKNLNFEELMSDGPYKEKYRQELIMWSDQVRLRDPGYFCRAACGSAEPKPYWIVSDIRRKTDINWFKQIYGNKIRCVRISADLDVRVSRGFVFTSGVDDVTSECDLDDYSSWDAELSNSNVDEFEHALAFILKLINVT